MIPPGKFHADLGEIEQLLRDRSLFRERNAVRRKRLGAADLSGLNYKEQWDKLFAENDYDFQLVDQSILSFQGSDAHNDVRYVWLESPKSIEPIFEFARIYLAELLGIDSLSQEQIDALMDEYGEDITLAYEAHVAESPLKQHVTPLRYELHHSGYREGYHPLSHLHVGQNENIRLGCLHVLTPMAFTMFVLRHVYCEHWRALLDSGWVMANRKRAREFCEIPAGYGKDLDRIELWLA